MAQDARRQGRRRNEVDPQVTLFADKSQQNPAAFTKLGDSKLDPKLDPAHVAALTVVCQAILNLDATIYER